MHRALWRRGTHQLLSWLHANGANGPAGAAARVRAWRSTAARLGSDGRSYSRNRRRIGHTRSVRLIPGSTAGRARTVRSEGPSMRGTWARVRRLPAVRLALGRRARKVAAVLRIAAQLYDGSGCLDSRSQPCSKNYRTKWARLSCDRMHG